MKVLHIIDSAGFYGAESVLFNLIAEQTKLGLEPIIASIGERGIEEKPIEIEATNRQYRVEKFRMRPGPNFPGAYKILQFAHRMGIDILHSHGYKGNILFGFIPKSIRKLPLVSTLHGWTSTSGLNKLRLYQWLDQQSLRYIDAVVLVNKGMLSNYKLRRLSGRKRFIVNNGIPTETDQSTDDHAAPAKGVIQFCEERYTIGSIGRLSKEKGYNYLVDAIARLHARGIDCNLVLIGDGPLRCELNDQVSQLNLSDRILMPGYLKNARQYISFFDVFALSSLTEGLPMVLLEAMQANIPIVATAVGGIPDVLDGGNAGRLVQPAEVQVLAEAIYQIQHDPRTSQRLVAHAGQRVNTLYSSRKMALDYLEIYNNVRGVFSSSATTSSFEMN